MGSGAVIYEYVPSFIKIGSVVQKLIGGDTHTHRHTHGQQCDLISLLCFFKIGKSLFSLYVIYLQQELNLLK
jgi:hypothetical protein